MLVIGVVLVVLIIGGAVTGVVLNSSHSSSGSASAGGAAASPAVELTGAPSADELLGHVPSTYRDSCRSVETDMQSAAVKLECPITGSKVTSVTHFQYNSVDAYQRAVASTFTADKYSDCSEGPGQGSYRSTTASGKTRSGLLACEAVTPVITYVSSTDQLWVISIARATYDFSFGYPQMKGSWEQYPLE